MQRLALDPSVRRATPYRDTKFGPALQLLRSEGILDPKQEQTIASIYGLISDGRTSALPLHTPVGKSEDCVHTDREGA